MTERAAARTTQPWRTLTDPTAREVAEGFAAPPPEYGPVLWWGWTGHMTPEVIARDLDDIKARGFRAVMIEAGYGLEPRYLSEAWFETVRLAVAAARERDLRVYLVDEGKYPSGFAGGKFTRERPDLCMQALVVLERLPVAPGETLARRAAPEALGALAVNLADETSETLDLAEAAVRFTAPSAGQWEVWLVGWAYRTAVTRDVHNPTQQKDASSSLYDYLNPEGLRQFLAWVHEGYARALGAELGRTVLGMRGDEPDYAHIPWTPDLPEEFARRKGYDARPHLAGLYAPRPTEGQRRFRADYWDVWSALFAERFFRPQAAWCAAHGMDYLVHLNHEDQLPKLVRSEGDFFRPMRHVTLPGVDAIWNQIWPDRVADFSKLASSAAHLHGRPRAFTESFAAYRVRPTVREAAWVINQQFVRGLNLLEVMFYPSSASAPERQGFLAAPEFPALATYVSRASYLLSQGRPVVQVALYYPTSSLWLGDDAADAAVWRIAQGLLEAQRDFDFVDEEALAETLRLEDGALVGGSGQRYGAVLVPPASAISRRVLQRLEAFARAGGTVIVLGPAPALVVERTFRDARGPADVSWARQEPGGALMDAVLAALPAPDVQLEGAHPAIKYTHRRIADADVYLFFNEADEEQSPVATLQGRGAVHEWDAATGRIEALPSVAVAGGVRVPLGLGPWEARCLVIGGDADL